MVNGRGNVQLILRVRYQLGKISAWQVLILNVPDQAGECGVVSFQDIESAGSGRLQRCDLSHQPAVRQTRTACIG